MTKSRSVSRDQRAKSRVFFTKRFRQQHWLSPPVCGDRECSDHCTRPEADTEEASYLPSLIPRTSMHSSRAVTLRCFRHCNHSCYLLAYLSVPFDTAIRWANKMMMMMMMTMMLLNGRVCARVGTLTAYVCTQAKSPVEVSRVCMRPIQLRAVTGRHRHYHPPRRAPPRRAASRLHLPPCVR